MQLNALGLPIRPGQEVCSHYRRTGACKYGPSCKFSHPQPEAVSAVVERTLNGWQQR